MNPTWQEFEIPHGGDASVGRCMAHAWDIIQETWPAAVIEGPDGIVYASFEDLPGEPPVLMGEPYEALLIVYRDRASLEEWNEHGALGNNNQIELAWYKDKFAITVDHDHDVSDLVERMIQALA